MNLKKSVSFLLLLLGFFILKGNSGTVYANPNDTPPSFEEQFREMGYKTVSEAVKEFEKHCNCSVKLPTMIPSIPFTHEFGKFYEDKEYEINDSLQIRFVHSKIGHNIFKIDICPLKNKLDFEGRKYTLQDGTKGIHFESDLFNFFVFEKNNLQYLIGIHNKATNIEIPEVLVDIANSIN
ncbi:carbon monoxide dehydrogenase, partial [Lysinibacillus telephonicus]|uniref:Carbon monoxide dehydrogenase n=1 Tax=Lysinibacillus telephonicus TaxID=1714840 RepID=A0A3S0HNG1_9BACI|nr:carbon monoxide dehydrogenase [Lysinibacillus telephonicus]RTQ94011.1 carbon monoxide dehydrogenase [Lysinibacillus telephonicus]